MKPTLLLLTLICAVLPFAAMAETLSERPIDTTITNVPPAVEPDEHWGENDNPSDCEELATSIRSGATLRNAGIGMMVGGALLVGVGASMVIAAKGETQYQNTNGQESGSLGGGIGANMIYYGIPIEIAGIVLTTIGIRKINTSREKQEKLNCPYSLSIGRNNISLTYSF